MSFYVLTAAKLNASFYRSNPSLIDNALQHVANVGDNNIGRTKLAVICSRFTAQFCRMPSFSFAVRQCVFDGEWLVTLEQCSLFVHQCDKILADLFANGHFNSNNVRDKLRKLENRFRSSLRVFEGRYGERLNRAYVSNFHFDLEILNGIEELLTGFQWDNLHNDAVAFNRFEILLAKNNGRELAPHAIERILQETVAKNFQKKLLHFFIPNIFYS